MTLEEIEARWKAATPGPWHAGLGNQPSRWIVFGHHQGTKVADFVGPFDLAAIAAAPTDIACLLDRVRKERESHNESIAQMHDELARYKRAHAFMSTRADPMSVDFYCDICDGHGKVHEPNCEWLKAKELRL